jgi:hypothetical protein
MSSAANPVPIGAAAGQSAANGLCFIEGRVVSVRSFPTQAGRLFATVVTMPAVDEYTSPARVEILSESKLASVGDTLRHKCRVGGRPRSYTSKASGEIVQTAEINLRAVES